MPLISILYAFVLQLISRILYTFDMHVTRNLYALESALDKHLIRICDTYDSRLPTGSAHPFVDAARGAFKELPKLHGLLTTNIRPPTGQ